MLSVLILHLSALVCVTDVVGALSVFDIYLF